MSTAIVLVAVGLSLSLLVGSVYSFLYWQVHHEQIKARFKRFNTFIRTLPTRICGLCNRKTQVVPSPDVEAPAAASPTKTEFSFRLSKNARLTTEATPAVPEVSAPAPLPEAADSTVEAEAEPETEVLAKTNNFFGNLLLEQEKEAISRLSQTKRQRAEASDAVAQVSERRRAAEDAKAAATLALTTFCEKVALSVAVEDFLPVDQSGSGSGSGSEPGLSLGELVVVVGGVGEIVARPETADVEVKLLVSFSVARFSRVAQLPRPVQAQLRSFRRDFQEADYALLAVADQTTQAELELLKLDQEIAAVEAEISHAARIITGSGSAINQQLATRATAQPLLVLPGPPLPKSGGSGSARPGPAAPVAEPPVAEPARAAAPPTSEAFPSVEQLREWGATEPDAQQQQQQPSYRRRAAEEKPQTAAAEMSMEEKLRREREKQEEYAKAYAEYYRDQQQAGAAPAAGPAGGVPEGFFFQPGRKKRATNTPKVGYEDDMNSWQGKTVYALKKEIVKELEAEVLRESSTEGERRTVFKQLAIRWHPDKNPDNRDVAKRVFQFIQSLKDWFLAGQSQSQSQAGQAAN